MCIFCKIVNKEIPSDIVLENSDFIAFNDIAPKASTHILIIPKKHIESFNEITSEISVGINDFILELVKKLKIDKTGYRLITNIGEDGGQEVPHLHFHILAGKDVPKF